ncbi:hypothetical protein THAOC_21037, partial [Thalassiosira oceanica]
ATAGEGRVAAPRSERREAAPWQSFEYNSRRKGPGADRTARTERARRGGPGTARSWIRTMKSRPTTAGNATINSLISVDGSTSPRTSPSADVLLRITRVTDATINKSETGDGRGLRLGDERGRQTKIVQSEPRPEEPRGDGSRGGGCTIFALRGHDPRRAG